MSQQSDDATPLKRPAHQRTVMVEGVVFSSDFDSGNLKHVASSDGRRFEMQIATDGEGTPFVTTYRSWFYFSVATVPKGRTLEFVILNMPNQARLFNVLKSRPMYRLPAGDWARLKTEVEFSKGGLLSWTFTFTEETAWFAFSFPFSFADLQKYFSELDREIVKLSGVTPTLENVSIPQFKISPFIKYKREKLCESLEKRPVDLLVITEGSGEKDVVFITARVHAGETPGQFACVGLINFLVSADPRAQALRRNFEFRIIPCLNPDGVALGYYRNNTRGMNLNRYYDEPVPELHEGVFFAATMLKSLARSGRLLVFVDLHGHANKSGCFLYGNHVSDASKRSAVLFFAKLMQLNSPYFELEQSNFSLENMQSADAVRKFSDSVEIATNKESSARVALFKETGHLFCYTLECSFAKVAHERKVVSVPGLVETAGSRTREARDGFCPAHWAQVGEAVAVSVLDMWVENKWSRLTAARLRNIPDRDFLRKLLAGGRRNSEQSGNSRKEEQKSLAN